MDIRLLGAVSAFENGLPLQLGGAKQRAVLAMLALEPNRVLSVDQLAEGVWGPEVPDRYVQNVQVYVSTLRRILEPERTARMPSRIAARGVGYELIAGLDEIDLSRFRTQAAEGARQLREGQPATASIALRSALAEWRGEACADLLYQPFLDQISGRLREERWAAFEACVTAELAIGRSVDLVPELEDAVSREPTREHLWEQLATALFRAGRQEEALAACRRARERLLEEAGLEPGPRLRELEHEILIQAPSLDAPVRAAARSAAVPVPLTSLVGRDDLVHSVVSLLAHTRLVVLTGPGGVGKTRLALAVASEVLARGSTVWFVDLSSERNAERVLRVIASAASLGEGASEADLAALADSTNALIVVDNFEQVLAAAAVVLRLVTAAPSARVLVTSRARLGVPGERAVEVEPLATDGPRSPATRLFWERALEVDPKLDAAGQADAVEAICRSLEGMPLAIELAASRVAVLDPIALADRVGTAVESIIDVGSDAHRAGSLRAAILWSVDLLTTSERALFAALSVCESSVDLPTVQALGRARGLDEHESERALEGLARASLVRIVESPAGRRFAFLATTKAVARDELTPEDKLDVEGAHSRWFAQRSWERAVADEALAGQSLAGAVADLADCEAACRRLVRADPESATRLLGGLLATALVTAEGYGRVASLAHDLIARGAASPAVMARAKTVAAGMAYVRAEDASALLSVIDELDRDDHFFLTRACSWRAALLAEESRFEEAARSARLALKHAEATGIRRLIGVALSISGYVALAAHDPARALAHAQERLSLEPPSSWGAVAALVEAADALLALDRLDEAEEHASTAVSVAVRLNVPQGRGEAYRCLAWCALGREDSATAAACILKQLAVFHRPDGMLDRYLETTFTTGLAAALAGDRSLGQVLWATGEQRFAEHELVQNFPRSLSRLADRLGIEGGEPSTADLDEVMALVESTLHTVAGEALADRAQR